MKSFKRSIRALALLPMAGLAISGRAQTNFWASTSSFDWSNPANWSLGLPSIGQTLEIGAAGQAQPSFTILDSGNYNVANLISYSFLYLNGGSLDLASAAASSQINGLSVGSSTLTTSGLLMINDSLSNGGVIDVLTGGSLTTSTLDVTNTGVISVTSGAWNDSSNFVDNGAAGQIGLLGGSTASFTNGQSGLLLNSGTITVDASSLTVTEGSFLNGGMLSVRNAGTLFTTASSLTNEGTISTNGSTWNDSSSSFSNTGQLNIFDSSQVSLVNNAAGEFANLGTISVDGSSLESDGVAFINTNSISINEGALVTNAPSRSNAEFINSGIVELDSSTWNDYSSSFDNQSTGRLELGSSTVSLTATGGNLSNEGSITIDNSKVQESAATFSNSGTVSVVDLGTLTTAGGKLLNSGSISITGAGSSQPVNWFDFSTTIDNQGALRSRAPASQTARGVPSPFPMSDRSMSTPREPQMPALS